MLCDDGISPLAEELDALLTLIKIYLVVSLSADTPSITSIVENGLDFWKLSERAWHIWSTARTDPTGAPGGRVLRVFVYRRYSVLDEVV